MTDKERKMLKGLSSQIWSEPSVNLPFNEELRTAVSNLKVIECSWSKILSELKKLKNYDYFLILKIENSHYFFDTSRLSELEDPEGKNYQVIVTPPLIKVENYNIYVRKDKLKKLNDNERS